MGTFCIKEIWQKSHSQKSATLGVTRDIQAKKWFKDSRQN